MLMIGVLFAVLYFLTLGWNGYKDRQVSTCIIDTCNIDHTQKWCRDTFDYDAFSSLTWKFSSQVQKNLFANLMDNCIQERNTSCYRSCNGDLQWI